MVFSNGKLIYQVGNCTNKIIGITGFGSSGKSTLLKHVSKELKIEQFSLEDYQREKFAKYGSPINYHNRLGLNITYYGLWDEYLEQISKLNKGNSIIIDGIYTSRFIDMVAERMGCEQSYIINVCAPTNFRIRLFSDKTGLNWLEAEKQLFQLDKIKMDVGIIGVIRRSNFILNNNSEMKDFLRRGEDMVKSVLN